jgi:hypothetical protein
VFVNTQQLLVLGRFIEGVKKVGTSFNSLQITVYSAPLRLIWLTRNIQETQTTRLLTERAFPSSIEREESVAIVTLPPRLATSKSEVL